MKNYYTFHSHVESQTTGSVWSISKEKSAELQNKRVRGISHLRKYSVIIGGNGFSSPGSVDSNPFWGMLN